MSDENIFEKAFGKAPDKGYEFKEVQVEVIDTDAFKGFDISWCASGIGFGHVSIAWGMGERVLKDSPRQYGFHCSTEYMSKEFVQALMKEAAPKIAGIIVKHDIDK